MSFKYDLDSIYYVNDLFEKRSEGNISLYVNFDSANWVRTDEFGNNIICLCDGKRTLREVIDMLAEKYKITSDIILKNCEYFLNSVIKNNLLYSSSEKREEVKNWEVLSYPESVWIHVSSRCNLACEFCYSSASKNQGFNLENSKIREMLTQIPEEFRTEVIISGGEPFLYKDLIQLIKELKVTLKYREVRIITNGTVGHDAYGEIKDYIDSIQFSVDGVTSDINDLSRGTGAYDKMVSGLKTASEVGFKSLLISFTTTKLNCSEMISLPEFAFKYNVNQIHISRLMPVGRGIETKSRLDLTNQEFGDAIQKFAQELMRVNKSIDEMNKGQLDNTKIKKNIGVSFAGDISPKLLLEGRRRSCGLGDAIMSINYDGCVYPCPSLHVSEYVLGRYEDSMEKLVEKGHLYNNILSVGNSHSDCYECKYKYFCGGGCKANSRSLNGVNKENEDCLAQKAKIDYLLMLVRGRTDEYS